MAMAQRHLEVMREKEFSEISLPGVSQTESKTWAEALSSNKTRAGPEFAQDVLSATR